VEPNETLIKTPSAIAASIGALEEVHKTSSLWEMITHKGEQASLTRFLLFFTLVFFTPSARCLIALLIYVFMGKFDVPPDRLCVYAGVLLPREQNTIHYF
jgi:hypothetical protein